MNLTPQLIIRKIVNKQTIDKIINYYKALLKTSIQK